MLFMTLSEWLKERSGRGRALALGIGVPQSFVSKMVSGEKQVPVEQCVPIERFTLGAVTCEELRPDKAADFAYLREGATPQPTTGPAAGAMVPLLQSGLEKAEQALADEPTDRVARLIKRNRAQALAEIAATPQPNTEPAAAGV